ncbi:hypothetical protein MtrunA17_Chr4g0019331 [Medicago truncatula]|uniref:Uncharacterized protein n=1 Tax=Medicago truncatula TaxID=3880 RepID=A0A396I2U6_MEDTR|nr:hypothetical protein MtrunA17_Chr4g0019331 [Medicago truncatula]
MVAEVAIVVEGFEYVVEVEVAQNEAELEGKDKTEAGGRLDHGQVGDSSAHVAVQQVEAAVVVGELASDSEIVGPQESAHVTLAETVLEPEAVLEVEPATGAVAVSVSVAEVEAGHRPVGIVEQQTVDRGNTVDTAVGMDLVRGIAGSIVDIVAAVDTIAPPLAAQQFDLKLGFEMLNLVADSQHAQLQ